MTKEEKIKEINRDIEYYCSKIDKLKEEKRIISEQEEYTTSFLIREYETEDSKVISKEVKDGNYTIILGGDGRSMPYDKKENGKTIFVTTKNTYLSDDLKNRLAKYIEATMPKEVKAIRINDDQVYPS